MREELGITEELPLKELFRMKVRNELESENVQEYSAVYGGPFTLQQEELDDARFFTFEELKDMLNHAPEAMTPLLVRELVKLELNS